MDRMVLFTVPLKEQESEELTTGGCCGNYPSKDLIVAQEIMDHICTAQHPRIIHPGILGLADRDKSGRSDRKGKWDGVHATIPRIH
jgi:hypothetical protein